MAIGYAVAAAGYVIILLQGMQRSIVIANYLLLLYRL